MSHGLSRPWKLTKPRERLLRGRLADHGAEELPRAVDGYVEMHRKAWRRPEPGFDPRKTFTPETIFAASKCAKYLEVAPHWEPCDQMEDPSVIAAREAAEKEAMRGWE